MLYQQLARLERAVGDRVSRRLLHRRDANERNAVQRRATDRDLGRAPCPAQDNFAVIAASGGDQIASDYPAKRHGLFTYYTLLGLRGAADADADRTVTVGELEQYLDAHACPSAAASLDREQTPVVIAREQGSRDR